MQQTLELPAHHKAALADIFEGLSNCSHISSKEWERILGKLRFISCAIPGSSGLFSTLQLALSKAKGHCVQVTWHLHAHIIDFVHLATSLCSQVTYLTEIVPQQPTLLGATDAAKPGMGGVFFNSFSHPHVW